LRGALADLGNARATVKLILVDDDNSSATIEGRVVSFADAIAEAAKAEAVVMMAGTISEEGADRATFAAADGKKLAAPLLLAAVSTGMLTAGWRNQAVMIYPLCRTLAILDDINYS
jgi:hypothetical protein